MRKLADTNYICSKEIESFLKCGGTVVLSDFFMYETFKGNVLYSLSKSFSIISNYTSQIEIMKSLYKINVIRNLSPSGLQKRLIDRVETASFPNFCKVLYSSLPDEKKIKTLCLEKKNTDAINFMIERKNNIPLIFEGTQILREKFSNSDLRQLFFMKNMPNRIFKDFASQVVLLSFNLMFKHKKVILDFEQAKYSFSYRYALCSILLVLKWMLDGKDAKSNIEKLNNDIFDIGHITSSTYFDGFLSFDRNALFIYDMVPYFLPQMKHYS
jgi:hypothetical protein